ncbi:MAG: DUF4255 domain-containing protein [Acidobacteria bacterium]|nr:DUF4255 domain-containing protein [Acidobacteriota bacterium]
MPLADISRATETLTTLIRQVLARDSGISPFDVSAAPPEDETNASPNYISVYLFHIAEDPHSRNFTTTAAMTAPSPVQQTPMGLVLNYVVTARSTTGAGADRTITEQRMLGYVARALHDYPVIDDSTVIPSIPPAPPNPPLLQTSNLQGTGNVFHLTLRPVTIDDAVNFWSAEQELTARLSLFYEMRVVMLQTPPAVGGAPPVLSLSELVSVSGRLTLSSVRSLLGFALPPGHPLADPGSPFRFIDCNPARAALFPPGAPPPSVPPENNRFTFEGAGLRGDRTWVSLFGPAGEGPGAPADRRVRFRADQPDPANVDWAIEVDGVRIALAARMTLLGDNGVSYSIYPGVYRARVIVGTQIGEGPAPRFLEQSSADCGFAIVPQIEAVFPLGGPPNARQFRITLYGAYLRDELEVRLSVAGQALRRDPNPAVAGNFNFASGSADIDFAVDTTALASPIALQLMINGAEAPPAWGVF